MLKQTNLRLLDNVGFMVMTLMFDLCITPCVSSRSLSSSFWIFNLFSVHGARLALRLCTACTPISSALQDT